MKFTVFWDVAPFSPVGVDQRFGGAYCLHHQGERVAGYIGIGGPSETWAD
jgi:hypothetical protein